MSIWCDETFGNSYRVGCRVERTLFSGKSAFQQVDIIETPQWGKVLLLDGMFMTSERDEFYYHELITHPAMTTARQIERVLVIGGGDGGTVREVLRYPQVQQVTMVEIDGLVVDACRQHLPTIGRAWDDPRLDVRIGDGIEYVGTAPPATYDVILLDGSDPVGPAEGLVGEEFYGNCRRLLREGGVFVLQSQSPILFEEVFYTIQKRLGALFREVHPIFGPVPLYGTGNWSWTWASDGSTPWEPLEDRLRVVEAHTRYYNRDIHRAALALPNAIRQRLR